MVRSDKHSALGMPSIALDFAMKHRRQVIDASLQPGGVMWFGHPPLSW